jgi:hypothetical protein
MKKRLRALADLLRELGEFAAANKAWWLLPVAVMLLAVGGIIWAGGGGMPLIYTLF